MALEALHPRSETPAARFVLDELSGRLTELRAGPDGAALTCAFGLVLEAQRRGEPVAYVGDVACGFFPPDAAQSGVDLDALVVVRTSALASRGRAADELARSGAFSLIVVDLVTSLDGDRRLQPALISRLMSLAQKHATAIVFLSAASPGESASDPSTPSPLGSLISLRAVVTRRAISDERGEARHVVRLEAIKDKRGAPGWTHEELCRGPAGTC